MKFHVKQKNQDEFELDLDKCENEGVGLFQLTYHLNCGKVLEDLGIRRLEQGDLLETENERYEYNGKAFVRHGNRKRR